MNRRGFLSAIAGVAVAPLAPKAITHERIMSINEARDVLPPAVESWPFPSFVDGVMTAHGIETGDRWEPFIEASNIRPIELP